MSSCSRTEGCTGTLETISGSTQCSVCGLPPHGSRSSSSRPAAGVRCPACQAEVVDTGDASRPARFCGGCGNRYPWVPDLQPGDLVADQYRVEKWLAQGGIGRVYLAEDTHLGNDKVVLKGVIDESNASSVRSAVAERRFLIALSHENIVRIRNFVLHTDRMTGRETGFIVMEFLDGLPLNELRDAARDGSGTLTLADILTFGREILDALGYVHRRNLLYTDMKPSNVIRVADRVKVIDIGSVCDASDPGENYPRTWGYYPMKDGPPTVRSDLYSVGVTLHELFRHRTRVNDPAAVDPDARDVHRFGAEPFRRLIKRARRDERGLRFASAAEMAAQVAGILRDVRPDDELERQPETSELFAPSADLLDAGLGMVPPLHAFTDAGRAERFHSGQPPGPAVAAGLPTPRVPGDDVNAAVLATLVGLAPGELLDRLDNAALPPSTEVELARCRAWLRLGDVGRAGDALARAGAGLAPDSPHRWRIAWHRGLLALAHDDHAVARSEFDDVYDNVPGECPPRLALAYCAERAGGNKEARDLYLSVRRRDRLQASAAFGLARLRLAEGKRSEAVEELDTVPPVSAHFDAARIAAVRILAGRLGDRPPDSGSLNQAAVRTAALRLDGGDHAGPARQRLITVVRQGALAVLRLQRARHATAGLADGELFGAPPSEQAIRLALETSFRALATQASTAREHGVLVDRANTVRPWSRL